MEVLRGTVNRIIFMNENNTYAVFLLQDYNEEYIPCVIKNKAPKEGDELEVTGNFIQHPRYGHQLEVAFFERLKPDTIIGVKRYILNLGIKGLGEKSVEKIIAYFEDDIVTLLRTDEPKAIMDVPGIRAAVKEELYNTLIGEGILSDINRFLEDNGISSKWSHELYEMYGANAIAVLRDNPYVLIKSCRNVNFQVADTLASHLGFSPDDDCRIECGVMEVLNDIKNNGHTCIPLEELIPLILNVLGDYVDLVVAKIESLLEWGTIYSFESEGVTYIYPPELYIAEVESARLTKELMSSMPDITLDSHIFIRDFERKYNINLGAKQKEAILQALQNKLSIITGGPGTGKTTIVKALVEAYHLCGKPRVLLCAPTGRAAKRLSEAANIEATTIHRLLMPVQGSDDYDFMKNEDDPLEADVIIVDEASMLNIQLYYALISAVPKNAILVIVGDVDQLPPIGAGFILRDLLACENVSCITLDRIYRQQHGNLIVENAHLINEGKMPILKETDEFIFIPVRTVKDMTDMVSTIYKDCIACTDDSLDVQIISPMRRGIAGSTVISKKIQDFVNPADSHVPEVKTNGIVYRVGDKVIQVVNNYELDVFNGEIGIITAITKEGMKIRFTDKDVTFTFEDVPMLMSAYAITVHKSQGSEYGTVILPFVPPYSNMLQRNLLYTAVTRARDKVIIVGTQSAIERAVHTVNSDSRYTLFKEHLQAYDGDF